MEEPFTFMSGGHMYYWKDVELDSFLDLMGRVASRKSVSDDIRLWYCKTSDRIIQWFDQLTDEIMGNPGVHYLFGNRRSPQGRTIEERTEGEE